VWFIFYGLNVLLALVVAKPLQSLLESKLGNSLIIKDMVKGFDYTIINDFMVNYGEGFTPIINQSIWLVLVFMLMQILLVGGLSSQLVNARNDKNLVEFWKGMGAYFWRFLRLTIYFLLINGAVLGLFFLLYYVIIQGGDGQKLESEGIIFIAAKIMIPIYLLVAAIFLMWQDYAKLQVVEEDSKMINGSILNAYRFIKTNFRATYGLYLLNWLGAVLIFGIYWLITNKMEINSANTIWIAFALSQIYVLVRIILKVQNLVSIQVLRQAKRV